MNIKTTESTETVWRGEPWDEELTSQLPRPSAAVRSAIYEAARAQADQRVSGTRWTLAGIRQVIPAVSFAAAALMIIAAGVWYVHRAGILDGSFAADDQTIEQMTDYVTKTFGNEELTVLTVANETIETEDSIGIELSAVSEELALLEDDIRYDYFSL
jgi:hypothetical protein